MASHSQYMKPCFTLQGASTVELEKIFAERLATVRQAQRLSQRQLALRIGLSPRAVGQFEQGENWPSLSTLVALARALDCSTDYLLGLSDNPHCDPSQKGGEPK